MRILASFRNRNSFHRVKDLLPYDYIQWKHVSSADELREELGYSSWDVIILCSRLWWYSESLEILSRFQLSHLVFEGDFDVIKDQLVARLVEPVEEISINDDNDVPKYNLGKPEPEIDEGPIKYIEKDKIIKQEVKVFVPEYIERYSGFPAKTVTIVNLSPGAGSSFLTHLFAEYLTNQKILASIIENPLNEPYFCYAARLEEKASFQEMKLYDYPTSISNGGKVYGSSQENIIDGIRWLVPLEKSNFNWTFDHTLRLIYLSKAAVTFIDLGSNRELFTNTISESDITIVVVDPLPAQFERSEKKLEELLVMRKNGHKIEFVVNKYPKNVEKKQLIEAIGMEPIAWFSEIEREVVYSSAIEGHSVYSNEEIANEITEDLNRAMKLIVPPNMMKIEEPVSKGFITYFKKKIIGKK